MSGPVRVEIETVSVGRDGVGLPGGMTPEGYDEAIPRVLPAAEELAKQGANVISVFGSSLTFYKGAKFNDELIRQVTMATGRPATAPRRAGRARSSSRSPTPTSRRATPWSPPTAPTSAGSGASS